MAYKSSSPFTGMVIGEERQRATLALNRYRSKYRAWERQADRLPNLNGKGMGRHVDFSLYLDFQKEELAVFTSFATFEAVLAARLEDIDKRVKESINRLQGVQALERSSAVAKATSKGVKRKRGRPRKRSELTYGQHVYLMLGYNHGKGASFDRYVASFSPTYEVTPYDAWEALEL